MQIRLSRFVLMMVVLSAAAPDRGAAQVEIEADPIAYALSGFSLHVAKVYGSVRASVGTFGLDVPAFLHGNEDWGSTMRGAGVKLDYLGSSIDGFFVGVDGGYMRVEYSLGDQPLATRRDVVGIGARGGYRRALGGRGLYVAPWLGISYNFDGADVVIDGREFDRSAVMPFATVHIGWRF